MKYQRKDEGLVVTFSPEECNRLMPLGSWGLGTGKHSTPPNANLGRFITWVLTEGREIEGELDLGFTDEDLENERLVRDYLLRMMPEAALDAIYDELHAKAMEEARSPATARAEMSGFRSGMTKRSCLAVSYRSVRSRS